MKRFISALGELSLRVAGFIVAVVAIGLTVALVIEYTGTQNSIAVGVALLCVFISAVGGLLARSAWRRGAYPEFAMGLIMWGIGATFLGINELGYWSQNYESRYSKYLDAKHARTRSEAMNQRDFDALITGTAPATVAQITAALDAKKLDPLYARSQGCASVTKEDSRGFCQELFHLKGQLAKAEKIEAMEARVNAVTPAANPDTIAGNVFANAELLARWFGGDERKWADFITIASLLVLMVMRDCGFLVAFPLGRRRAAATLPQEPRKADPVQDALQVQIDALTRVAETLKAAEKTMPAPRAPLPVTLGKLTGTVSKMETVAPIVDLQEKPVSSLSYLSEKEDNRPDGGGGTQAPSPEPVDNSDTQDTEIAPENVEIKAENVYEFIKPSRIERTEKLALDAKKKPSGKVTLNERDALILAWAEECGTRLPKTAAPDAGALLATDAWRDSYVVWAKMHTYPIASKQQFAKIMRQELGLGHSKEKGSTRSKKGSKLDFFRYQVPSEMPIQKRARA